MGVLNDDFQAWYDAGAGGKSQITVVGKVTEIDGSSTKSAACSKALIHAY